jgi:hypothetical protein
VRWRDVISDKLVDEAQGEAERLEARTDAQFIAIMLGMLEKRLSALEMACAAASEQQERLQPHQDQEGPPTAPQK